MTPQQLILFRKHQHLPERMSRRWPSHFGILSRDDLISVGTIGLIEAALRHDGSPGFEFYARGRICGAIIDEIRKLAQQKRGRKRVRSDPYLVFKFVSCDKLARTADQEAIVGRREELILLRRALSELPPRTRWCIEMHCHGVLQTKMAAKLKVSQVRVHQIIKQGIDELRKRVDGPQTEKPYA
jgi:RNA polymerase sigma factor (sigma-70 family)